MVTKDTLETLAALRRLGAKHVAFSGAGELLVVDFFEPEPVAADLYEQARQAQTMLKELGHGEPDVAESEVPTEIRTPGRRLLDGLTPDDPLFDGVRS